MILEVKTQLPEPFFGERKDFKRFCTQFKVMFDLAPQRYSEDTIKINSIVSCLRGVALEWYIPVMEVEVETTHSKVATALGCFCVDIVDKKWSDCCECVIRLTELTNNHLD